jgi:SAM-dependent methyltransferase
MRPHGGDFDYDAHGQGYAAIRRPDPRIAAPIHAALGDARTVLNVGAGAGSYEPADRHVIAIEPSAAMRAQRGRERVPAIAAFAEALPLDDGAVDAAMAVMTVHQWSDLNKGLAELRRVSAGPVVVTAADPDALGRFWLNDYAPELFAAKRRRYPPIAEIAGRIGATAEVQTIRIPRDCTDGLASAFYGRPESFLDPAVRAAQSSWRFLPDGVEQRFVAALSADLESGRWDQRYGHYRTQPSFAGALRLIVGWP